MFLGLWQPIKKDNQMMNGKWRTATDKTAQINKNNSVPLDWQGINSGHRRLENNDSESNPGVRGIIQQELAMFPSDPNPWCHGS